jgi:hypothetical protein
MLSRFDLRVLWDGPGEAQGGNGVSGDEGFEGAQLAYSWRKLEPGKDEYDFSLIREDLSFLSSKGKKLFVQIQDVSFSEKWIHVPR